MDQLGLFGASAPAAMVLGSAPQDPPAIDLAHPEPFVTWLRGQLGKPVRLVFTNNRTTFVSAREHHGLMHLRLHQAFAKAGPREVEAILGYLKGGNREANRCLGEFIAGCERPVRTPRSAVVTAGRCHDLAVLATEVNVTYFHGSCTAQVTWGVAAKRRRRRTIQLGCFVADENLIRIHPCLDQAFVPRPYVAWVIFHEMLHEVLGVARSKRRRRVHPPEFGAMEATFPGYQALKAWEVENLPRLMNYRHSR